MVLSSLFNFGTVNKDKKCCATDLDNFEESLSTVQTSPFKLPIHYNKSAKPVPETVLVDLEMHQSQSNAPPMNHYLFAPSTPFAKKMAEPMVRHFTTDKQYLGDTRDILMNLAGYLSDETLVPSAASTAYTQQDVIVVLEDIGNKEQFMDKYYYLEWQSLESLNRSSTFLQGISMMNGVIPLFNIFMTFLVLVLPFVLILLQGKSLCLESYIEGMRFFGKDNMFTQMFTLLDPKSALDTQGVVMVLAGVALYAYQLYYNIHYTSQFYRHLWTVSNHLLKVRAFLQHSEERILSFMKAAVTQPSYSEFVKDCGKQIVFLRRLLKKLEGVCEPGYNLTTISNMGYHYECYYLLHAEGEYRDLMKFCCDFSGFYENCCHVALLLNTGKLNRVQFDAASISHKEKEDGKPMRDSFFEEIYYPTFVENHEKVIKNDVDLSNHNYIVTGPNASGKTTFLKTVAINVLVSQQYGCGFFLAGRLLKPYTYLHSYINIPDTSERDSLFEAETRRCKEILTAIEDNPTEERHFCIFDELFSGTNPEEAAQSAISYLKYLCKKKEQVDFILTTHYLDVCHAVESENQKGEEKEEKQEEKQQEQDKELVTEGSPTEEIAAEIAKLKQLTQPGNSTETHSVVQDKENIESAFAGRLVNYRMQVETKGKSLLMKYRLESGISEVQGAFFILQNMGFPKEMMHDIGKKRKPVVLPVVVEEDEDSFVNSAPASVAA